MGGIPSGPFSVPLGWSISKTFLWKFVPKAYAVRARCTRTVVRIFPNIARAEEREQMRCVVAGVALLTDF